MIPDRVLTWIYSRNEGINLRIPRENRHFRPLAEISFGSAWKAGKRISAVSGLAITALAIACAVIPTAAVVNVAMFEAKLAAGTLAVIASAWLLYRKGASR